MRATFERFAGAAFADASSLAHHAQFKMASPQPTLTCPACGYSLRGQTPLGRGQVLRCPECGVVTSIGAIVRDHARRQREAGRVVVMMLVAAVFLACFALLRPMLNTPRVETSFTAFGFFLGAGMSLMISALWDHPPPGVRWTFVIGGGAALAAAVSVSPALVIAAYAWWFAWQAWAAKRGYL